MNIAASEGAVKPYPLRRIPGGDAFDGLAHYDRKGVADGLTLSRYSQLSAQVSLPPFPSIITLFHNLKSFSQMEQRADSAA